MCRLPLTINNFKKELTYIKHIASVNGFHTNIIDKLVIKHSEKLRKNNLTTLFIQNNKNKTIKRVKFNYNGILTDKIQTIYNKYNINLVFKNNSKLRNILGNAKDKNNLTNKSGIYQISCNDCDKIYIGQSKRAILTRFKEHISHIKYNRPTKSAFAEHALENNHLNIETDNLKLIKNINDKSELDAWESLYIEKNRNFLMNNDPPPIISPLFDINN